LWGWSAGSCRCGEEMLMSWISEGGTGDSGGDGEEVILIGW